MCFGSNKCSLGKYKLFQNHLANPKHLNGSVDSGSQVLVYLLFALAGAGVLVGGNRHSFFLHHPHKTQLRLSVERHSTLGQLFDPHSMVPLGWQHVLRQERGDVLKLVNVRPQLQFTIVSALSTVKAVDQYGFFNSWFLDPANRMANWWTF